MKTNASAIRTAPHAITSEIIYLLSSSIGSPKQQRPDRALEEHFAARAPIIGVVWGGQGQVFGIELSPPDPEDQRGETYEEYERRNETPSCPPTSEAGIT